MSEFEDRINSILGNPAEMEKIMNLASQFMGGGSGKKEEPQAGQTDSDQGQGSGQGQSSNQGQGQGSAQSRSSAQGPDLSGLGGLGGLGGFDAEMFSKIGRIMSQVQGGSEKTELLRAMGPYLKQERREKMEKAIRFARIAKVAGAALREYGGGKDV